MGEVPAAVAKRITDSLYVRLVERGRSAGSMAAFRMSSRVHRRCD